RAGPAPVGQEVGQVRVTAWASVSETRAFRRVTWVLIACTLFGSVAAVGTHADAHQRQQRAAPQKATASTSSSTTTTSTSTTSTTTTEPPTTTSPPPTTAPPPP